MKNSLIFLILLSIQSLFSKNACEKCNIEKVRIVHENINQLNVEMISDFLCTFDLKCKNNIEFTEFSNEIFFLVLEKSSNMVLNQIISLNLDSTLFLNVLQNPVHDLIDIQKVQDAIKSVENKSKLKEDFLTALLLK
ncbi:MAG: hypothetical protein ACOVLC_14330 [Flavobacterium sp.]